MSTLARIAVLGRLSEAARNSHVPKHRYSGLRSQVYFSGPKNPPFIKPVLSQAVG